MSKIKSVIWPKVILFGDSITQVWEAESLLRCYVVIALVCTSGHSER